MNLAQIHDLKHLVIEEELVIVEKALIPKDPRQQKVLINQRLKDRYYSKFEDIEKDFVHLFLTENDWLRKLWDRYHPIEKRDTSMLMVYWIYGETGVGKTTFAENLIYDQLGYQKSEVMIIVWIQSLLSVVHIKVF